MKLIITSFLITIALNGNAQEIQLYTKAINYVKQHNREKRILVTNEIALLNFTSYSEEVSKEWHKDFKKVLLLLDSVDQLQSKSSSISLTHNSRKDTLNSDYVLFSSVIYKNMVIIEIVPKHKNKYLTHNAQAELTPAKQYLVIFNDQGLIKQVVEKTIQYE
jgi:hypothetical protein